MAIKQQIKFKNEINFEADQQDAMKKTENIRSLADQVEKLEELQTRLNTQEEIMKDTKKQIEKVSGDITLIISLTCEVSRWAAILGIKFFPNVFAEQTIWE